ETSGAQRHYRPRGGGVNPYPPPGLRLTQIRGRDYASLGREARAYRREPETAMTILIDGERLRLTDVERVARDGESVRLDPAAHPKVLAARAVIERALV